MTLAEADAQLRTDLLAYHAWMAVTELLLTWSPERPWGLSDLAAEISATKMGEKYPERWLFHEASRAVQRLRNDITIPALSICRQH